MNKVYIYNIHTYIYTYVYRALELVEGSDRPALHPPLPEACVFQRGLLQCGGAASWFWA